MVKPITLLSLALICFGCASSKPLPDFEETASPVEYADLLIGASKVGKSNPTIRGDEDGYRWSKSRWCANHDQLSDYEDLIGNIRQYCKANDGLFDNRFCRAKDDRETVLFAAVVGSSAPCGSVYGGGRSVTLDIVEPTSGISEPTYISKLESRGYQTFAQRDRQRQLQEEEFRTKEDKRLEEKLMRDAAMQSATPGMRICREGMVGFTVQLPSAYGSAQKAKSGTLVAQLDSFSNDANTIVFRVLSVDVPAIRPDELALSHSFVMAGFRLGRARI